MSTQTHGHSTSSTSTTSSAQTWWLWGQHNLIHPSISISASSQYVVHRYMDTPHPRSQPLLPSDPSDSATTTSLSIVSSESPSILWSGHICWGCFWQLSYLITLFIMQHRLWILDIALDIGPILSYYSTDLLWIIRINLEVWQRPV